MKENLVLSFVVICTLIFVMLALILAILVYRYNQNQNIYNININKLKAEHENEILKAKIQVQELTFQHISREIHDNIGQKLSLTKLQLNTLVLSADSNLKSRLDDITQLLTESLNDLRDLSRSMSSDFIAGNGFIKTIENEIEQLNRYGQFDLKLTLTGEAIYMNTEKEVVLFRIIQEGLNNIIKHAEATQIHIVLHYTKSNLIIEIKDNGVGFNLNNQSEGNGLNNIRNRARSLEGLAEFESSKGNGTNLKIKIPINDTD
jgi:hypothetical protein